MTGHRAGALAVALLLAAGGAREATAQSCSLPAWSPGSPLTTAVYGAAVTGAGGQIYSAGGYGSSGPVGQFLRYTPSSNTWTGLAPVPTPVAHARLVYDSDGGQMFLFGGVDATGNPTSLAQVYTIATNTWAAGPVMPGVRSHMASGVINGLIYLAGGVTANSVASAQNQLWRFNSSLGTYTAMATLPAALSGPGSAVALSRLYVMGGRASTGALLSSNYAYNPTSNTWEARAPLPSPVNMPAAVSLYGSVPCSRAVLLVGGGTPFLTELGAAPDAVGTSFVYDIGSNSWTAGPALASPRSFVGAAEGADYTVLAVGGWSGTTSMATTERLRVPSAAACNPRWQGAWTTRSAFPTAVVRSWGTYFPANGKFYVLGGRTSDSAGSDLLHPAELDPATGTWTTKAATFADTQVNNMVGGVLSFGSTPSIVLVGGSAAGAGGPATAEVRQYDPVADTMTTLSLDPWPGNGSGDVLPGGAAVYANKLYVFGGFQVNVGMTGSIWQFDPAEAAGARWSLRGASLPTGLGYIPATTAGSFIYLLGGSTWTLSALADSTSSLRYDPLLDLVTTIATIPRATAETRALAQTDGTVWVLGGGRTSPNPGSQVDVYVPGTNTWTTAAPLPTARRNFAADVDPVTGRVWAVGGYTGGTTYTGVHEELHCVPKGDVDRDGYPDLVFRSNANGAQNKVWIMNGVARASEAAITPDASSADWKIRGVDDFDGDGQTDLVFWNQLTGNVEFWLMNGVTRIGSPLPLSGGAVLPTNWDLAGTADFNHDHQPDIVWRNTTSQKIVIWTMAATVKLGNIIPSPDQAVDANWMIVAALDYNSDGNTDFLWYNYSSGKIVTWYMDAAVSRAAGQFTAPANAGDANWRVLASSDYSRGYVPGTPPLGSPDIVWRNETSGNQVVWHMDFGSTRVHGEFTNPTANTPALDWTIVGPR